MNNHFCQILRSYGICIEDTVTNELNGYSKLSDNSCSFLFDVNTGKCLYFCPSIMKLIGYTSQNLLEGGFLFLKSIIDPDDFPLLLTEIITLIKTFNTVKYQFIAPKMLNMSFRIRHKDGRLLDLSMHCMCTNQTKDGGKTFLIGFLKKGMLNKDKKADINFNITSREKEVLQLLSGGKTTKIIASELFISESTVITHRKHLIQKLKAKNSVELVKKSLKLNILK